MPVRCGGCIFWVPNSAKPKPAEHSQLSPPGSIALDEDGVDVYLSHCFHQGKKKLIKLVAFSLLQAGVRTGKTELDLRLQKQPLLFGMDSGTDPTTEWPQTAHPPAWGRHSMNHVLVPPDISEIKPEFPSCTAISWKGSQHQHLQETAARCL